MAIISYFYTKIKVWYNIVIFFSMLPQTFKIFFIGLILFLFGFNFFILPVKADDYQLSNFAKVTGYKTSGGNSTIEGTAQNILKIALLIMGILFLAFVIYAGMRWMTAQGNEELVTQSKDTLEAAIIGLAVVASAYAITTLIFQKVSGG